MANLIHCFGYRLGKVHTGMLAFLCQLHCEGTQEPLESLFGHLSVQVPNCPRAEREWNSIDLAISEGEAEEPAILVEIKVDDHEGTKQGKSQTEFYATQFPDCLVYLYITLGNGEYYRSPSIPFRWVRLREFNDALATVKTNEKAIVDWQEAVRTEVLLRESVKRGDYSQVAKVKPTRQWWSWWNLCFLGELKVTIERHFPSGFRSLDPTCYPCGTAPDTILNFGWRDDTRYLEINNNGLLNLKVSLGDLPEAEKRSLVASTLRWVKSTYGEGGYQISDGGHLGRSKTLVSFDVGLQRTDGLLWFSRDETHTFHRLQQVLEPFYGTPL